MTLSAGTRIGPYEILSALGAGGMGEVYHARDVRLERSVAIKALPQAFAADAGRRARFEREARLLAAFSHPNIAAIYGLEDVDNCTYLVLEFVEGETLGARLSRGPMGVREALETGAQIASAIEAAHERGIVHRDLKPANVMLTPAGVVKVLDFGLARGDVDGSGSGGPDTAMATLAIGQTGEGIILGTAPYMSPEQARGKSVDRRTDIWSFGCVLFECLSGRQAFAGETVSDVIAGIIDREPDWNALPAFVPARLCDVVKRCLTKNVADRPRDMGDMRRELLAIAQQFSSPSGTMSKPAADVPSLAVLYFENLADDRETGYFCAGITEDILTDLSKIKGLKVASRNAVARYRGAEVELSKIASDLGVRSVLQGTLRRSGDRVRITAQLINAVDGFQLWAERYDRTLEDVFAVQEEIASSIAGALRVRLTPAESENLVQNRPNDVRAYDVYLKGREYYQQYTIDTNHKAIVLFREAIEIDPDYALAFAGLADCYGQFCQWGYGDVAEAARLGLEAARRAIGLNPQLAEGHKAEALVRRFSGDLEGSRSALTRAIAANPRYTPALINLSVSEFGRGDLATVERLVRRAIEIDPQEAFAMMWLSYLLKATNRPEEAMAASRRVEEISSATMYVTNAHLIRIAVQVQQGEDEVAEKEMRHGLAAGADPVNMRGAQALLALRAGREDEARRIIHEFESIALLVNGCLIMAAVVALRLGEVDRAIAFLTRPILLNLSNTLVRLEPDLHPLLDLPPFAPRMWDTTLVWPFEAPMIDAARFRLFRQVRIESAIPEGSEIRLGG